MAEAVVSGMHHPGPGHSRHRNVIRTGLSPAGRSVEEQRTQLSVDAVDNLPFVHGLKL